MSTLDSGLRFVDSTLWDRFSLTISNSSQSFFESNSPTTALGAMVLTIRPDEGAQGDKEALVVGDNLAVGIQYDASSGNQYRLLLQDRVNYGFINGTGPNAFSLSHNTVFSEYAAVEEETTFAFNWNANGSAVIAQSGETVRTKFMSPWAVQGAELQLTVVADAAAAEAYAVLLDDGKGNIAELGADFSNGDTNATIADQLASLINAQDAYTATSASGVITPATVSLEVGLVVPMPTLP